jgi:predicted N-formylglutamate amidohydrolase
MEKGSHILLEGRPSSAVLVVCDHASNFVPHDLGSLGVGEARMRDHIAWDIGAGDLARSLAGELGAWALLCGNSRLVVDCNRRLDDPSVFPVRSDGVVVPGNRGLSATEREQRANRFYWPYHHAIRDQLCVLEAVRAAPAVISVHSFTPAMNGVDRPWHVGALYDKDDRVADAFLAVMGQASGVVVGDNQPYSGRDAADFTLDHHAEAEGLPHLAIEVRQDLIDTPEGVARWAGLLVTALRVLEDPALYTHRA